MSFGTKCPWSLYQETSIGPLAREFMQHLCIPLQQLASILPYKYTKLSNKLWNYQGCLCSCKTNVFFFLRLCLELRLGGTKNALLSHVFDAHQPPLLSCNRQQTGVVYMPWTQLFAPAAKFNRHEAIRGRQIFQNPVIVTS